MYGRDKEKAKSLCVHFLLHAIVAVHSHTHHIRYVCWLHLLQMLVVEVSSGEVEAPGRVSIVEQVTKVSPAVVLFLTHPQLTHRDHPGISEDVLREKN